MCILLYGTAKDCNVLKSFYPNEEIKCFDDTTEFIPALTTEDTDAVFILMDNAAGMEGAIAAKQHTNAPVIWASNDPGFAAQAFRLGVDNFTLKPLTKSKLQSVVNAGSLKEKYNETEKRI